MNKKTYSFYDVGGTIPGIPGEYPAGIDVDVDLDDMKVLDVRLRNGESFEKKKQDEQEPAPKKKGGE